MNYHFFLGGHDLEMATVNTVLTMNAIPFSDNLLSWGARASAYADKIRYQSQIGKVPVLVELEIDIKLPPGSIVIDHHGARSTEDASILQVKKLLNLPITRYESLVAANDCGYIPALQKMGATPDEISNVRLQDRKAQGVTPSMELIAEKAVSEAVKLETGTLVVHVPFKTFSPVSDRLFTSWPGGKENLIVICSVEGKKPEIYFFGRGDICKAVKEHFSDSWGGGKGFGQPDQNAFSGARVENPAEFVEFIIHQHKTATT